METEVGNGPRVPPWQAQEWRERGATLTAWVDASPKQRHGRWERRELWALSDPGVKRLRGQHWNGGGSLAAPETDVPGGAEADSERPSSDGGELRGNQSIPNRCRSGPSVADTPGALAHRKSGSLGTGCYL